MATIYRANDSQLGRDVAVKLLRPEYGRDPDFGERFRHEAQAAASLNHPNIVSVFDYGQDEAGPFIVMELVDGEDLATVIRRTGPLPPRQAARIAAEVARALAAAHSRGIVHRDVKPGNVLLARDGRVKVTDFGIARAIAEAQMTLPGTTLGSVHYFSPEQARGEPTTEKSDTYALGIVLYELLTGRRPWEGDSTASIALARLSGPVPSPSDVRSGIPPALDRITHRALALDPAERFDSAAAMAEALEAYLADRGQATAATAGVAAVAGAAGAGPVAATGPSTVAPVAAASGAVVAGVARANPGSRIPYADDAYAGAAPGAAPAAPPYGATGGRTPPRQHLEEVDDQDQGGGPWIWISGLLGFGILVVAAFLVFRFMSGPAATTQTVTVPNFVDKQFAEAQALAQQTGLVVVQAQNVQDLNKAEGTVTAQDPAANAQVAPGSTVKLTVVTGKPLVLVPNLVGLTEQAAIVLRWDL